MASVPAPIPLHDAPSQHASRAAPTPPAASHRKGCWRGTGRNSAHAKTTIAVPVTINSKKGETTVEVDEAPRRDTSLESLAKLPPIFVKDGTHTAGNSPGVNDGAGALVLASDEWAKREGRKALATIVAHAAVADDFAYLARTPANATKAALEKAGLSIDDVELFEINEAFASVALNSMRMLGVDEAKVNVNGGAIALGHPIGASGARILTTLVHELRRRGGGLGVAAICSGGGQGDAMIVEVNGA